MTTPSGIRSGVGFRYVQILEIGTDDYPASTATTVYEGFRISGAKALTLNDPEPRNIVHTGDDYVFALDVLPPSEPMTGELRTGKINDTVDAILTGQKSITIGEAKFFGISTDKRGQEAQVILLAYRQALETDPASAFYGSRRWEFRLLPKCILSPREGSLDENAEERVYTVTPQFVTEYPWGVAFTTATEGFARAQALRGVAEFKPRLVAFTGNNTETTFAFNTSVRAASTAKITVWVEGVVRAATTDYTPLTTAVVFTTAPASDANIVVFYETTQG